MSLPHKIKDKYIQANFDYLTKKFLDTGGQSLAIRVGVDPGVVFTASVNSALKTVTHGLGRTPIVAFAINNTQGITMTTDAGLTATTFNARGAFPSAISGTFSFFWMVIG